MQSLHHDNDRRLGRVIEPLRQLMLEPKINFVPVTFGIRNVTAERIVADNDVTAAAHRLAVC